MVKHTHLFAHEIVPAVATLPDQSHLVRHDGQVADEAYRRHGPVINSESRRERKKNRFGKTNKKEKEKERTDAEISFPVGHAKRERNAEHKFVYTRVDVGHTVGPIVKSCTGSKGALAVQEIGNVW